MSRHLSLKTDLIFQQTQESVPTLGTEIYKFFFKVFEKHVTGQSLFFLTSKFTFETSKQMPPFSGSFSIKFYLYKLNKNLMSCARLKMNIL